MNLDYVLIFGIIINIIVIVLLFTLLTFKYSDKCDEKDWDNFKIVSMEEDLRNLQAVHSEHFIRDFTEDKNKTLLKLCAEIICDRNVDVKSLKYYAMILDFLKELDIEHK